MNTEEAGVSRVRDAWLGLRFAPHRSDYYDYLADRMALTQGGRTLRDILSQDAARHAGSLRGHFSTRVGQALERQGGDLADAFEGCIPEMDRHLIRRAQQSGVEALEQTLRDLARLGRLLKQSRSLLQRTLAAALTAWLVLVGVLLAIPGFTAPRIQQAFHSLPVEARGPRAQHFFGVAETLEAALPLGVGLAGVVVLAGAFLLPRWTGRLRHRLDRWMPWRLYRNLQGLRFLALLAVVARTRVQVSVALRTAIEAQREWARPWLDAHLERMLQRIDDGVVGAGTLDTGLLDPALMWLLTDLIDTHGLDDALQRVQDRLHRETFEAVAQRAVRFKWGLLLSAVGCLLTVLFWHFGVVDELRQSLVFHYSTS